MMKITKKELYVLFDSDESNFINFHEEFKKNYKKHAKQHLIIKISDNINLSKDNILVFLQYSKMHRKDNLSFIIICSSVNTDNFPEDFNIAPTLQEAEDILEMENIQRDLGFNV